MREILFRGKRTDNSEWACGFYTVIPNDDLNLEPCIFVLEELQAYWVRKETVGQYTGFTDKNGTKIFEGDIVKGGWNTVFVVYYDTDYLQYRAKVGETHREVDYYGKPNQVEVIGNIHDNPELLEVDHD